MTTRQPASSIEPFGLKYYEKIDSPSFSGNRERCCCICGRACSGGPGQMWVFLSNVTEIITEEEGTGDALAFHRIGPTCARRVKKANLQTYVGEWPYIVEA